MERQHLISLEDQAKPFQGIWDLERETDNHCLACDPSSNVRLVEFREQDADGS